jgi:hypothetical protein
MIVEIDWTRLNDRDSLWQDRLCLYAYVDGTRDRILYIGKADYQTVRQRLHGVHKDEIFAFCDNRLGVEQLEVLHGQLWPEESHRRSSQLLADVESLLIMRLQPPCNVASTRSRYRRRGLRVKCFGDWPHRRTGFHDV